MMLTIQLLMGKKQKTHCVKSVCVRSYSDPHFSRILLQSDTSGKLLLENWSFSHMKNHFSRNLLERLCEIQEILYLPEERKNIQQILQVILTLFRHAIKIKIKIHMDGHVKSMSERKFYGISQPDKAFYRAISLFLGRNSNTEKEEAAFNTSKMFYESHFKPPLW